MNAFRYGAPPHGGMAFGFDRLIMLLVGSKQIRDVIAFPKTTSAMSLMDNSPSSVDNQQLNELNLSLKQKNEKTFKLKDIDPMVFSGAGDKNIKVIESHFNSTIVLRGNNLIVDGLKKEINDIELLIENITYTINNKGFIDSKDIKILINSGISSNNSKSDKSKLDNVILYTYKGAVVAQTKGQIKYYQSVCKNDIVFAVGPTKTGKTYQVVACAVSALNNGEVEKIVITRPVVEAEKD